MTAPGPPPARPAQAVVTARILVLIGLCLSLAISLGPLGSIISPLAYASVPTGGAAAPGWSALLSVVEVLRIGCAVAAYVLFVVACLRAAGTPGTRHGWAVAGLVVAVLLVVLLAAYWVVYLFTV